MHKGVTRQAQGRHAFVNLAEKRSQSVIGTDAERRKTIFATAIQAHWRTERLGRIGVGRKHKELKLGRHHRRQSAGRVTGNNGLQLTASR